MKELILCIRCGAEKGYLIEECEACGFGPAGDAQNEIKSIYLSTLRFEDLEEKERYLSELRQIGERLKEGNEVEYDANELDRLAEFRAAFLSITPARVYLYLLRLFWPVIALLGGMYLLGRLLQWYVDSRH